MTKFNRISLISAVASIMLGCTVGPDYIAPQQVGNIAVDTSYQQATHANTWWQAFDDSELNSLITIALEQNRSVVKAKANVARAAAIFNDANNNGYPVVGAEATYQASKNTSVSSLDDNAVSRGWTLGSNISWDLDLFGKIERASQAAAANVEQAQLLWHEAQVSLISQVAASYGDYRSAQKRLLLAEQNLQNLQQTRDIVNIRLEAGFASDFELARINTQYFEIKATVPQFRYTLRSAEATLSALLGYKPGQLYLDEQGKIPELSQPVAIDDSQNYLRFRADVASAERSLAASSANVGVVTADLYPNLSFSGFLGFVSGQRLSLNGASQAWSIAPSLSWQGTNLSSVKAQVNAANANVNMELANFEQKVIAAVNEMQLAVDAYNLSREQQLIKNLQYKSSMQAMIIARVRYEAGNSEFYALLDAEREWLRSRDQQVQIELQTFTQLVEIYRVFGGGLVIEQKDRLALDDLCEKDILLSQNKLN